MTHNDVSPEKKLQELQRALGAVDDLIARRRKELESYVNRAYENHFTKVNTLLNPSEHKLRWTHNLMISRSVSLEINAYKRCVLLLQIRRGDLESQINSHLASAPAHQVAPAQGAAEEIREQAEYVG